MLHRVYSQIVYGSSLLASLLKTLFFLSVEKGFESDVSLIIFKKCIYSLKMFFFLRKKTKIKIDIKPETGEASTRFLLVQSSVSPLNPFIIELASGFAERSVLKLFFQWLIYPSPTSLHCPGTFFCSFLSLIFCLMPHGEHEFIIFSLFCSFALCLCVFLCG